MILGSQRADLNSKIMSSPESLSHWNGEIEDLDTEQLANALSGAPVDDIKEEKQDRLDNYSCVPAQTGL